MKIDISITKDEAEMIFWWFDNVEKRENISSYRDDHKLLLRLYDSFPPGTFLFSRNIYMENDS